MLKRRTPRGKEAAGPPGSGLTGSGGNELPLGSRRKLPPTPTPPQPNRNKKRNATVMTKTKIDAETQANMVN